ncbi:MAG: lipid A biosynthesis acyltransferase [Crocinitomicaceae bacterium]|nr:lipid A biosynthesis acyltransferase [Crocinitomicaceae bacterium]|tara:strand:+ start:905 stop:1816 length:912 start_codon:yes stop_codon:yes gene_type:complete
MGSRIALALIKLISRLPFPVLYFLADVFFVIIYRLFGYRKKVVIQNLKNAFPNKSEQEIEVECTKYYRYLCDLVLEVIKSTSMSEKEIKDRVKIELDETYLEAVKNKRNIILVAGHYGNWEYAQLRYSMLTERHRFVGVYKQLGNPTFDEFLYNTRDRFGTDLTENKEVSGYLKELDARNEPFVLALAGDQTPAKERGYWMSFLNQDTPFFYGAEHYAKKFNAQVFFCDIKLLKRGFYSYTVKPLVLNPQECANGEVIESYATLLEGIIAKNPTPWLWSHKRWKHKRPEGLPASQISTRYPGK